MVSEFEGEEEEGGSYQTRWVSNWNLVLKLTLILPFGFLKRLTVTEGFISVGGRSSVFHSPTNGISNILSSSVDLV